MMNLPADSASFTAKNEGCCLEAKPDAKGMWVIGIGHDIPPPNGGALTCTQEQADAWFVQDLAGARSNAASVVGLFWALLDPVRQAAVVDMAFELGRGGLAEFTHMLLALRAKAWTDASGFCLQSAYAQEVPARARRVASMIATGAWPSAELWD